MNVLTSPSVTTLPAIRFSEPLASTNLGPPRIDMHSHTTHSDWLYDSADVVRLARQRGIQTLVTTDHDIVNPETARLAREEGIESFLATEISVSQWDRHLHILAYTDPVVWFPREFHDLLSRTRDGREGKIERQCAALGARGYLVGASLRDDESWGHLDTFSLRALENRFPLFQHKNLSNAHIMKALLEVPQNQNRLMHDTGMKSLDPALVLRECLRTRGKYARILGQDIRVPRYEPDVREVTESLSDTSRVLSLAHPHWSFPNMSSVWSFLSSHREIGAVEIGATAPHEWSQAIRKYARETSRILTFWSDFHGQKDREHGDLGDMSPYVPWDLVERHMDLFRQQISF